MPQAERVGQVPQCDPAEASPLPGAECADEFDQGDQRAGDHQQPHGPRQMPGLHRNQRQCPIRNELALRDEDHPRHRECEHQRQRQQCVDGTVGDAVLRQQQSDVEGHW